MSAPTPVTLYTSPDQTLGTTLTFHVVYADGHAQAGEPVDLSGFSAQLGAGRNKTAALLAPKTVTVGPSQGTFTVAFTGAEVAALSRATLTLHVISAGGNSSPWAQLRVKTDASYAVDATSPLDSVDVAVALEITDPEATSVAAAVAAGLLVGPPGPLKPGVIVERTRATVLPSAVANPSLALSETYVSDTEIRVAFNALDDAATRYRILPRVRRTDWLTAGTPGTGEPDTPALTGDTAALIEMVARAEAAGRDGSPGVVTLDRAFYTNSAGPVGGKVRKVFRDGGRIVFTPGATNADPGAYPDNTALFIRPVWLDFEGAEAFTDEHLLGSVPAVMVDVAAGDADLAWGTHSVTLPVPLPAEFTVGRLLYLRAGRNPFDSVEPGWEGFLEILSATDNGDGTCTIETKQPLPQQPDTDTLTVAKITGTADGITEVIWTAEPTMQVKKHDYRKFLGDGNPAVERSVFVFDGGAVAALDDGYTGDPETDDPLGLTGSTGWIRPRQIPENAVDYPDALDEPEWVKTSTSGGTPSVAPEAAVALSNGRAADRVTYASSGVGGRLTYTVETAGVDEVVELAGQWVKFSLEVRKIDTATTWDLIVDDGVSPTTISVPVTGTLAEVSGYAYVDPACTELKIAMARPAGLGGIQRLDMGRVSLVSAPTSKLRVTSGTLAEGDSATWGQEHAFFLTEEVPSVQLESAHIEVTTSTGLAAPVFVYGAYVGGDLYVPKATRALSAVNARGAFSSIHLGEQEASFNCRGIDVQNGSQLVVHRFEIGKVVGSAVDVEGPGAMLHVGHMILHLADAPAPVGDRTAPSTLLSIAEEAAGLRIGTLEINGGTDAFNLFPTADLVTRYPDYPASIDHLIINGEVNGVWACYVKESITFNAGGIRRVLDRKAEAEFSFAMSGTTNYTPSIFGVPYEMEMEVTSDDPETFMLADDVVRLSRPGAVDSTASALDLVPGFRAGVTKVFGVRDGNSSRTAYRMPATATGYGDQLRIHFKPVGSWPTGARVRVRVKYFTSPQLLEAEAAHPEGWRAYV